MTTTARWLTAILLLSVLLRVGVAFYLGNTTPPAKDETAYSLLASRLAAGYGYSFPINWYPFAPANAPTSHWSFLYTAVVAAIYTVMGANPLAARVPQAIICGLLMPWLTYRLAQRTFPGHAGGKMLPLLAAFLAAIYAYFVLYGAMVQTEAYFLCAVLWAMERAMALDAQLAAKPGGRNWGWTALVLGGALGVATLLRQSILPWLPVLSLWLLITGWRAQRLRAAAAAVVLVAGVVVLCIAPFTLRNMRVYGDFLLLNSNTGYAMYSAQHPMHGTRFQAYDAAPLPEDLVGLGLNEAQWDRALMQRGIGFILADPARYLLLSLSRVGEYFEFWPTADSSILFNTGRLVSFTLFLPFMLIGIYQGWRHRNVAAQGRRFLLLGDPVALSLLFVVFYSVLHILTWAMARYRLPVDAVLIPFAALGLLTAGEWARKSLGKRRNVNADMARLPDA